MAGAIVDVLIERLATLALDEIEKELRLVVGVKQEIRNLTLKLEAIRAVLEDAERRQVMEASVKLWLNQLNEVSVEMDDVLDEWITRVLMHQLEKQTGNAVVTAIKKVCRPSSSRLVLRHEIAKKIKELNEKLGSIDERKQSFGFQNFIRAAPQLSQRRKTTSLPNITFGRDNEKNFIISKLLSEGGEGKQVPLIIPIVGMGGMGKTSLANLVYNDDKIKSHFYKRIWVCVSDPFEEVKIAKSILESLGDQDKSSNELDHLMNKINEAVEGKKILLVLDDVWSPNCHQWEELIKPFRRGAIGTSVLVTTRKEEVATLMKAKTRMINLKELGEPYCLSLFYHSANMDKSSVSKEFADIGLEIVKRCKGLPLAAKTLGGLMRDKRIEEWRAILNSKTWERKEIEHDVFQPLLLSYHDLDPAIKRCLLYCVLFPKDHVYDRTSLIELWMSQDYLNVKGSKGNEIVTGQNYCEDLVKRSFFQDVEIDDVAGKMAWKLHDIVHDFLLYLTKNECFVLDRSEIRELPNDKVYHVSLVKKALEPLSQVSILSRCTKLRTLAVLGEFTHTDSISFAGSVLDSIVQLRGLRTLTLGPCWSDVKILKKIGGLIHLRYLDLSDSHEITELPSPISSLYNLQTLKLINCWALQKLDVRRLINLRHLYVAYCSELRLIKGIAELRDLQRLDWFIVPEGEEKEENKLEDLKDLNQLQGSLTIEIGGDPDLVENERILVNKTHLLQLSLRFWLGSTQELMNGLEPHADLQSLSIQTYGGQVLPSPIFGFGSSRFLGLGHPAFSDWLLSLHRLRVLTLSSSDLQLPPLGKLASLESLRIECLFEVSKVGVEFLGIEPGQTSSSSSSISFPNLKQLSFEFMNSWEEWEGVEENNSERVTIMPCLDQLEILGCYKLKALPDFLWNTPLQKLEIDYCPILQDLYKQGIGEEWAKISHIPSIVMNYDE